MHAIDSDILSLLINPHAKTPINPNTGEPVDRPAERVELLKETLDERNIKLLIPSPVLGEILVLAKESGPSYLSDFESSPVFRIGNFDTRAAVEAAAMQLDAIKQGDKKGGSKSDWQRVKVDRQIVAIAKANNVDILYTNDDGLKRLTNTSGIKTVSLWELPDPLPKQMHLNEMVANTEKTAIEQPAHCGKATRSSEANGKSD